MGALLVVSPAWVGDAVLAQPLLRLLKERYTCPLDVLAPYALSELYQLMPEVRTTFSSPFKYGDWAFLKRLRYGRSLQGYTHAYVLPATWKSALVPWAAGIRHRRGWLGEMRYGLLSHWKKLDKVACPMTVQRYAALASDAFEVFPSETLHPRLNLPAAVQKETLSRLHLTPPAIVLCPGAAFGPAKRWGVEGWSAVASYWTQRGHQVWLVGARGDQAACSPISKAIPTCVNLCNRTSLTDLVSVLSVASIVVSNDSGAMHIAAALERPQVAIFGSSSPERTPPLNPRAQLLALDLPCRPCFQRECPLGHLRCLKGIVATDVIKAMEDPLG